MNFSPFMLVLLSLFLLAATGWTQEQTTRLQTPKPPFPYKTEEVVFTNNKAGIKLAGTLLLPPAKAPHPAVVLVSGSGGYVRKAPAFGHQYFLVLADHLARHGIAVLHYDKRGCGQSEGDRELLNHTMSDFADDALAAVAYLKERKEVNPQTIGFYGHSEGASVVPLAASRSGDVAFIALAGASVLSADKIILSQVEAIAPTLGEKPEQVQENLEALRSTFETVRAEPDNEVARTLLLSRVKKHQPTWPDKEVLERFGGFLSPYFRFHLAHDQTATIQKVKCPILVANGSKDLLILEKVNITPLQQALKDHPNTTIKVLPNLNHMLQPAITGSPEEYDRVEETMSPAALELITTWIKSQTQGVKAES